MSTTASSISTKLLTKGKLRLLGGTGSGRSVWLRGMNNDVIYGIRQGMQFALANVAGSSRK
nr:hypothetical protein [Cypionkella psychrotolerans]